MNNYCKTDWLEELPYEESLEILTDLAWSHVKDSGPFRSLLSDWLRGGRYDLLCDYELLYDYSVASVHYEHARQALAFFQKWEPLDLGLDKARVAFEKFAEAEKACKATNTFLQDVRKGAVMTTPFVAAAIHTAQRKIAHVLGKVPKLSELDFGFGPGATTTTKSRSLNWATKLRSDLVCSNETVQVLEALAQEAPFWFFEHAHACNTDSALVDVIVGPGRLSFVPKSAKTYRSIIVEPIVTGFAQQGVGKYLRGRLRKVGVDLDDQSRNRLLAQAGSRTGSLATIDLSAASDTISLELVAELLPLDWFSFLRNFRTSKVTWKGVELPQLEKFSSMGNSFTFELETLLFWGLSSAVLELMELPRGWLAVYGDDIVIPTEAAGALADVFAACGFKVNSEKSFTSGPFRESCGGDFFLGTDIRPYYQKRYVSGESLFTLHNFYMRKFDFARAKKVRRYIHPSLAIFGPDGYGDGHLIGSWSNCRRDLTKARGWEGAFFKTYQHRSRRLKRVPDTGWGLPLYCAYKRSGAEDPYDPLVIAGSEGYKSVPVYTLRRGVFLP